MEVTTKDTKQTYQITLRTWDGNSWLPDLDWLVHCHNTQKVWLDVEEVWTNE